MCGLVLSHYRPARRTAARTGARAGTGRTLNVFPDTVQSSSGRSLIPSRLRPTGRNFYRRPDWTVGPRAAALLARLRRPTAPDHLSRIVPKIFCRDSIQLRLIPVIESQFTVTSPVQSVPDQQARQGIRQSGTDHEDQPVLGRPGCLPVESE